MSRAGFREPQKRRGVQMTASARLPRGEKGRPAWKDELSDDEGKGGGDEKKTTDSNLEWAELEKEVQQERRKIEFATGGRGRDGVVGYDDVASEEDDSDDDHSSDDGNEKKLVAALDDQISAPPKPSEALTERLKSLASVVAAEARADGVEAPLSTLGETDPELRPEGAITAGQTTGEAPDKKRAGKKRSGASRRDERAAKKEGGEDAGGGAASEEEGDPAKKRKLNDSGKGKGKGKDGKEKGKPYDPEKWVKLRLKGEEKPKKIDATRVVSYFDFDTRATEQANVPVREHEAATDSGNFRSRVRMDLYEDEDEEDECLSVQGPAGPPPRA